MAASDADHEASVLETKTTVVLILLYFPLFCCLQAYRKPNAYIATQGPSKYTLNDIWLMAWLEHTTRIVMVTNLVEDGRVSITKSTALISD